MWLERQVETRLWSAIVSSLHLFSSGERKHHECLSWEHGQSQNQGSMSPYDFLYVWTERAFTLVVRCRGVRAGPQVRMPRGGSGSEGWPGGWLRRWIEWTPGKTGCGENSWGGRSDSWRGIKPRVHQACHPESLGGGMRFMALSSKSCCALLRPELAGSRSP